jgi:hypothetical protein
MEDHDRKKVKIIKDYLINELKEFREEKAEVNEIILKTSRDAQIHKKGFYEGFWMSYRHLLSLVISLIEENK